MDRDYMDGMPEGWRCLRGAILWAPVGLALWGGIVWGVVQLLRR